MAHPSTHAQAHPPPHSLDQLPEEVLQHILSYLTPRDVSHSIQRTSKLFYRLGKQPLLWRHYCRVEFKYWDSEHSIRRKFSKRVAEIDWKKIYADRRNTDFETTRLLDSILAGQTNRIHKFEAIAKFGYDSKDTLLRHCNADDGTDDVLARRYFANAVLGHVHRSKALREWEKILNGEAVTLERALGSFDLFVLHDQEGDLDEISDRLDNLAAQLRGEVRNLGQMSHRKKALATVTFLREHNLIGLSSEIAYRDLQNNYIGIALQDQEHPCLPLISVSIFCALARRVGLDARCCGIPNHVHAMVYSPAGETLDGRPSAGQQAQHEAMYLDPHRSESEIPLLSLRSMLSSWGIGQVDMPNFLTASSTASVVLRTSRNLLATVNEFRTHGGQSDNTGHPTIRLHGNPFADLDVAFYSALWANFIFGNSAMRRGGAAQSQYVPLILERFERLYSEDVSLIEKYIVPLCSSSSNATYWELREAIRVVKAADQTRKQVHERNSPASREGVRYKIGQVFRHRRYGYTSVIIGWDIECGMTPSWIRHNAVDSLKRGRHQSFYHTLVEDNTIRYVAEENIEIIRPEFPSSLMSLAGRFFKRWDKEERVFVSNIRDEYPED